MKHPESSEWMKWIYEEATSEERQDFEAHLAVCPECLEKVERWRRTMEILDEAAVPKAAPRRTFRLGRTLPWLAATAALMVAAFWAGREHGVSERELAARLSRLAQSIRQDAASQHRAELTQVAAAAAAMRAENRGLVAELARQFQEDRVEDRSAVFQLVRQLDDWRSAELAEVRGGLAELAAHTGMGFEQTQTQMQLLAGNFSKDRLNSVKPAQENP